MTAIQITDQPCGHILTNTNVWSPDGRWIVYDTRPDPAGEKFDGCSIEIVNVETREVREIFRAKNGAHCGVATFSPTRDQIAFILGPENPTNDWQYCAWHRQGVILDVEGGEAVVLDARDTVPPFTPGALRGGSHVHIFDGAGEWVSFTYEDHVLATLNASSTCQTGDLNQRNIGISAPIRSVQVPATHPRNHNGSMSSALVSHTVNAPRPGSDEISRAFEDAWIGTRGYVRRDGSKQRRAIAFQGNVVTEGGATISEVFVVDIPDDITHPGDLPLAGTETTRPAPPRGVTQRRLTYTAHRKFPGLQGPRHWLRSSPDGSQVAFLMRDDAGVVQVWLISPNGGHPKQLTYNSFDIGSAFSWKPDGSAIAYIADGSVFTTEIGTGATTRRTGAADSASAPRPEACVFAPDGERIAYIRPMPHNGQTYNQVFVVLVD